MKFKDAFDHVTKTIREDKGLYYAYQSNIAMAFQDEVTKRGYRFPDLHEIANQGAKNFLDLLIAKGE